MGADIAAWCAWNGLTVTLADMKSEPLGNAIKRAAVLLRQVGQKSIDVRDALDRLMPDLKGEGVRSADLIIEAVPEVLGLKQKIYAATEAEDEAGRHPRHQHVEHSARTIARRAEAPGSFCRPAFLQSGVAPATRRGRQPRQGGGRRAAAARAFLGGIDRLPAPVKSAPGFLVNRALMPYLVEALIMVDEGIKKETIDAAAEDFGMPMGPIELADEVGLDICLHVADVLREQLRAPDAGRAAMAARQGRERRTRQEDRQGPLRLEGRQSGEGARRAAPPIMPTA